MLHYHVGTRGRVAHSAVQLLPGESWQSTELRGRPLLPWQRNLSRRGDIHAYRLVMMFTCKLSTVFFVVWKDDMNLTEEKKVPLRSVSVIQKRTMLEKYFQGTGKVHFHSVYFPADFQLLESTFNKWNRRFNLVILFIRGVYNWKSWKSTGIL